MRHLRLIECLLGALLLAAVPVLWLMDPPGAMLSVADLFRWAAVLVLGQGLARDLAILALRRAMKSEGRRLACLCVESSLGLLLLAISLLLALTGSAVAIVQPWWALLLAAAGLWFLGYLTRDVVIRFERDPDHVNILVW